MESKHRLCVFPHQIMPSSFPPMEEILNKFGDEQSTLLDQFERLSFEIHLNRAILARSLSEPTASSRTISHYPAPPPPPPNKHNNNNEVTVSQPPKPKRSNIGFQKVIKKLLRPIFSIGRQKKKTQEQPADVAVLDHSNSSVSITTTTTQDRNRYGFPVYSRAFSRSVRV